MDSVDAHTTAARLGDIAVVSDTRQVEARTAASGNPGGLHLLDSLNGVNTPPKGASVMKFSFANPEPSVAFAGFLFGFEIVTFENNYGIDPAAVTVERGDATLTLTATGFTYAGGQQCARGRIVARLRRTANGAIEWQVSATAGSAIKAIKTIVRGLPRGRLSKAAETWQEVGEDEVVFEYPALAGGMATPLVAIEGKDGRVWGVSALQTEVRPARFAFLPGPDGYKVELIYEQAGWDRSASVETCSWRIVAAPDFAAVAKTHFATIKANWALPDRQTRPDAPGWLKDIACVLALHGEHWSGYVFNDFDRQLAILRWTARQINPAQVMVFLPGWDSRFYWDYPAFEIGATIGGETAFARLIREGRKLGFRMALMFGANIANTAWKGYAGIADARLHDIYGAPFPASGVDWDGDRKGDSGSAFMNLSVKSWRDHLLGRIADMVEKYGLDAYFLDICGMWENNQQGDMLAGTRMLVEEMARRHPGVAAIAEMQYDAQMAFIPINQAPRYPLYPQANYDVVASFNHLSWPAPGFGSTGVHEYGFNDYKPVTIDQLQIPTITFAEDTFSSRRNLVMTDIATAKARFARRNKQP